MKKCKVRKFRLIIFFSLILFWFLFITFKNKSFDIDYKINSFDINEVFVEDDSKYYIHVTYNGVTYPMLVKSEYEGKEIVNKIINFDIKDETCIEISSDYFPTKMLCSNEVNVVDKNLVSSEMKELIGKEKFTNYSKNYKSYKDMNVYNFLNNKIYIWNYKGFDFITDTIESVDVFDNDIYDSNLVSVIGKYILFPDYSQEFNFNKFIILDTSSNKYIEWKIDYDISYNSYIVGYNEKSIYLVDSKNEVMYEIVPSKEKMRVLAKSDKNVNFLVNGKWTELNLLDIINEKKVFTYIDSYDYFLKKNKLYLKYVNSDVSVLVSEKSVDKIIYNYDDGVLYLVDNKLYYYNTFDGEVLVAEKDEWLFNSENKVFMIIE